MLYELLQAATPTVTLPEGSEFGTQFGTGAFVVFLMQLMKKWSALPWISQWTPRVNRAVAVLASFLSTIGIHTAYSSVNHTLLISGLSLTGILGMIVVWAKQFAYQEFIYQSAANRTKVDLPGGAVIAGQKVPPGGAIEAAPPQAIGPIAKP
jgi:hypothetical protein